MSALNALFFGYPCWCFSSLADTPLNQPISILARSIEEFDPAVFEPDGELAYIKVQQLRRGRPVSLIDWR